MVRVLEDGPGAGNIVVAVLRPEFLFGGRDLWPFGVEFCVLSAESGRALFCPDARFAAAARARGGRTRAPRLWRFEGAEPMLATTGTCSCPAPSPASHGVSSPPSRAHSPSSR